MGQGIPSPGRCPAYRKYGWWVLSTDSCEGSAPHYEIFVELRGLRNLSEENRDKVAGPLREKAGPVREGGACEEGGRGLAEGNAGPCAGMGHEGQGLQIRAGASRGVACGKGRGCDEGRGPTRRELVS